jgi:hypothetical protein
MMIRVVFTDRELTEFKDSLCLVITAAKGSGERTLEIGFTMRLGRVMQSEESARAAKVETFPIWFTESDLTETEAGLFMLAACLEKLPDPAAREATARLLRAAKKLGDARRSKYQAKAAKAAERAKRWAERRATWSPLDRALAVFILAIVSGYLILVAASL